MIYLLIGFLIISIGYLFTIEIVDKGDESSVKKFGRNSRSYIVNYLTTRHNTSAIFREIISILQRYLYIIIIGIVFLIVLKLFFYNFLWSLFLWPFKVLSG